MAPELSPEQLQAVNAVGSAIVVTASAGSGKTEVVARRVERLLDESPNEPFRVLALSYTVKAADELRDRLAHRLGDARRVDTDTIHAFAHNIIRQHGTWAALPPEPELVELPPQLAKPKLTPNAMGPSAAARTNSCQLVGFRRRSSSSQTCFK